MLVRTPSGFIEPCLPSTAERPPSGPDWVHEIKHDGYRLMARRDPVGIRLLTRRGNDWTTRFALIVEAVDRWARWCAATGLRAASISLSPLLFDPAAARFALAANALQ
jgi:hypothetical protein